MSRRQCGRFGAARSRSPFSDELAKTLFVSEVTVKSHLSHIYGKLGVDARAGAVAAVIEQRIIRR